MNGAGGPMCDDHGLSSSKCMSGRFAGSRTLRGKNMDGAGGSTSRSFADSSVLRGQVVDGKAWNCRYGLFGLVLLSLHLLMLIVLVVVLFLVGV